MKMKKPELRIMNFSNYLKRKGHSSKSIKTYQRQAGYFLQWLEKQNITTDQVTNRDILAYIKYCTTQNNTQRTIQNKLGSVGHYYQYLIEHNEVIANPVKDIEIKGVRRNMLHHILEPHQLHQLYQCYPDDTLNHKRNKVALGLIVYQGLKTEELIKLEATDVNVRGGEISIPRTRKGNERTLKLEPQQIFDLYDYLQQTRPELLRQPDDQRLFIHYSRFSVITHSIKVQLKKINPQAKNLKQLRASVITKWLKIYNLREVQYRAGHRYVSSTEKYKQNDLEGLQEEINQFHPLG